MMRQIEIITGDLNLRAEIFDTLTGSEIYKLLPVEGTANIWGDEIYFGIGTSIEQEPEARAEVNVGELGYWPVGSAFCIFFGPTPVSNNGKPRAYSPVNVFGKITGDAAVLRKVRQGEKVVIKKAE